MRECLTQAIRKKAEDSNVRINSPLELLSFFYPLRGCDGFRHRPAARSARGGSPFRCGKTSGRGVTRSAERYTSSVSYADSFPSRGSLLVVCSLESLPLEGKVGRIAPRMRCSRRSGVLPYFFSFLNRYSSTLPLISSQILRSMGNTSAPSTRLARNSA